MRKLRRERGGRGGRITVRTLLLAVGAAMLAFPAWAAAQSPAAPGNDEPRPDGSRVMTGGCSYRMLLIRGGEERELGTYAISVQEAPDDRMGAGWLVVQETDFTGRQATTVDSVWLDGRTLYPIRRVSHSERVDLVLEYGEREVRGQRSRAGDGSRPIRASFRTRRYSSSVLGPLLQSLPLRGGFRTRLPLFDDGQGPVEGSVRIMGSEAVRLPGGESVPACVISVDVGEREATAWASATGRTGFACGPATGSGSSRWTRSGQRRSQVHALHGQAGGTGGGPRRGRSSRTRVWA